MCDHISYALHSSGLNAYKLYPYGPIEEMMPYLTRRLSENKGFVGMTTGERNLIGMELKRRIFGKKIDLNAIE
jgi:proline dehydrogenase